jgi:hypothetical protein
MSNNLGYEFPLKQNAYAAFDAISLRNLIIERLNDQGIVTDQNFIGSNLASIIDIISFSYNTLLFYLNKTSNESLFSEAQIAENVNNIVKLLNYKPIGIQTSTLSFQMFVSNLERGVYTIPRYTSFVANNVYFSFNEDITFDITETSLSELIEDVSNEKLLYQGSYNAFPSYTAIGDPNELVYTPISVPLDHFCIDVYVYEKGLNKWFQYTEVPSNYGQKTNRVYEKRLTGDKIYEFKFGDGIHGRQLNAGDIVAVYGLQSSQENGIIGPSNNFKGILYRETRFEEILKDVNEEKYNYVTNSILTNNIQIINNVGSTSNKAAENVDSIKSNASNLFRMQNRLLTKEDFETFINVYFSNIISSSKVFDNWEYTGEYLKYFYDINVNPAGYQQILFNQVSYADSCNFNNVYICGIPRKSANSTLKYLLPAQKELIITKMQPIKMMTTEITFMDPIYKAVSFGVIEDSDGLNPIDFSGYELLITKLANTDINSSIIQKRATKIIKDYFASIESKLGETINYTRLLTDLLSLEGVSKIETIHTISNKKYEGMKLVIWNPTFPEIDRQNITNLFRLRKFEALYFDQTNLIESKINVI